MDAFIEILLAVFAVLGAAAGGWAVYLTNRRTASGKVDTSEASILWQQSQDMRAMALAEKQRAEEQRDRLIQSYTEQVLPMLAGITTLIREVAGAVGEGVGIVRDIQSELEGGGRAVDSPAGPQDDRPSGH